jgi:hypothetical protein
LSFKIHYNRQPFAAKQLAGATQPQERRRNAIHPTFNIEGLAWFASNVGIWPPLQPIKS